MPEKTRLAVVGSLLLTVCACTLSRPLAYHAVSYNRTIESAQNRMLLLNIVRASYRMPMYFTGIGSITASLSYTADSGSLSVTDAVARAVTGAAPTSETSRTRTDTDALTLPSVSYKNSPTATVSVLDTQDFVRGILQPVSSRTFRYYWGQDWNVDVLMYLLVERVEVSQSAAAKMNIEPQAETSTAASGNGQVDVWTITNDPRHREEFLAFREFVNWIRDADCQFKPKKPPPPTLVGVADGPATVSDMVKAQEAGLSVERLEHSKFEVTKKPGAELQLRCSGLGGTLRQRTKLATGEFRLVLRSPQGVLYYLGEVSRVWLTVPESELADRIPLVLAPSDPGGVLCPWNGENATCAPLFLIREGNHGCKGMAIDVEFAGQTYAIPSVDQWRDGAAQALTSREICETGRSMQALTLASQLISLQKSAKDLPGTALVQVVGD